MSSADDQREFFLDLYRQHGDDARSLSHRDEATQQERFRRAARGFPLEGPYTVHEVGCGLGHFGDFLQEHHPGAQYSGSDICAEFVQECRSRLPSLTFEVRDFSKGPGDDRYDYLVLIGVFNARLHAESADWQRFIFDLLRSMYSMCRAGIAVDFLTSYHDPKYAKDRLHYQNEGVLLDFVNSELSRHFELDKAGPLYEYNLRVWRPEFVRKSYPGTEFDRYFKS